MSNLSVVTGVLWLIKARHEISVSAARLVADLQELQMAVINSALVDWQTIKLAGLYVCVSCYYMRENVARRRQS